MKLSEIFSATFKPVDNKKEKVQAEKTSGSGERINRQIKALTPGRLLQGEVVGRNGKEVQIKLSDDIVVSARLDRDVNVEDGKMLTFEVKNNGSSLSLSPLFANTANTDNVFKALQMAGLPINSETVSMTEAMMQQGMSVDSNTLQGMFREVSAHPDTAAVDVVQLRSMGIEVTEENLRQLQSYKELTHELVRGMTDVLQELPAAFNELYTQAPDKAVQMYQAILKSLLPDTAVDGQALSELPVAADMPQEGLAGVFAEGVVKLISEEKAEAVLENANSAEEIVSSEEEQLLLQTGGDTLQERLSPQELKSFAKLLAALPQEAYPELEGLAQEAERGTADTTKVLQALSDMHPSVGSEAHAALAEIFKSDAYQKLLLGEALKQWTMKPEQVTGSREVEEVYRRLEKGLSGIREALSENGAAQSGAMRSAANLSQNVDFMNQVNQMYTYVQIPLKMHNGHANGELYVYTNKRSLANRDGAVSALLHLDMENLGPVDVYVAMQQGRVNTRFTLRDDEMLDFLQAHIHILNERLEKKGYAMNVEMSVREENSQEETPIERILHADKKTAASSQYAFDVRA